MGSPMKSKFKISSAASNIEVFNQRQIYIAIGDQYEEIIRRVDFALLDPSCSKDPESLKRLALITALQYAEYLPDHLTVEATLKRLDWKYALHLPPQFPGVTTQALVSFRQTTMFSKKAVREYDKLVKHLGEIGLYDWLTKDRLNGMTVLSSVCMINHYYHLNQAMKDALAFIISNHPDWLRANLLPYWYERYKSGQLIDPGKRCCDSLREEAARIGKDIQYLLTLIRDQSLSGWADQAEIQGIAHLYNEQFVVLDGRLCWRPELGSRPGTDFKGKAN